jgi:hypothetical protein
MSPAEANACLTVASAAPLMPRRCVTVVKMDMRRCLGMKAATTMMSGKNEMNALPARAILRSTNSVSSIRSQTFHSSVCSARPRMTWTRLRSSSNERRPVPPLPGSAMILPGFRRIARGCRVRGIYPRRIIPAGATRTAADRGCTIPATPSTMMSGPPCHLVAPYPGPRPSHPGLLMNPKSGTPLHPAVGAHPFRHRCPSAEAARWRLPTHA